MAKPFVMPLRALPLSAAAPHPAVHPALAAAAAHAATAMAAPAAVPMHALQAALQAAPPPPTHAELVAALQEPAAAPRPALDAHLTSATQMSDHDLISALQQPNAGPYPAPPPIPAQEAPPPNQTQYGSSLACYPNGPSVTPVLVPETDTGDDWTVNIKVDSLPGGANIDIGNGPSAAPNGYLQFTIRYTLGSVTFVKGPFPVYTTGVIRGHIAGRRVQVDIQWVSDPFAATDAPINVSAGVCRAGLVDSPLDFFFSQHGQQNVAAAVRNIDPSGVPGGGVLLSATLNLTVMSGDPAVYLMFFDSLSQTTPANGSQPILTSPAMTSAPSSVNYSSGPSPTVRYTRGLQWALSSTSDTFTAPSGSPLAVIQADVGR